MIKFSNQNYWENRYLEDKTGWDIGFVSDPIKAYVDQLESKDLNILVPGVGYGHEVEYLYDQGFHDVTALDVAKQPLDVFKRRNPKFPEHQLVQGDFFAWKGTYDLIIEQTFFCSFEPLLRPKYVEQMFNLLKPEGKLVGVMFSHPLDINGNRPYGGSKQEYENLFAEKFDIQIMAPCYNSIAPRQGNELFIKLVKPQ